MERAVLAAVDGSTQSTHAAHWAAAQALRRGVPLRLVHVAPWPPEEDQEIDGPAVDFRAGEQRMVTATLDEVRSRYPGLEVHSALVRDEVIPGLVAAARGCELLVLGSRGLGGFAELLVGSVSLDVCGRAAIPTVVVRDGSPVDSATSVGGQVVLGVDATTPADAVIEFAFAEAALRGASVRAVYGWNIPPAWSSIGWAAPLGLSHDLATGEAALLNRAMQP